MNCPRCKKPLVPGRLAPHSLIQKVQTCESCRGTFIGPEDLQELESQERTALVEIRQVPSAELQAVALQCPACSVAMDKVTSPRDEKVIMDVCPKCRHTWLDGGEIDAIQVESLFAMLKQLFRGAGK
jgi:Zn-finger nucleic acid-binding protein